MYKRIRDFHNGLFISLPVGPSEDGIKPFTLEQEHLCELDKKINTINKNLALFDGEIKKINKKKKSSDRVARIILIIQLLLVLLLLIQK